MRNKQAEDISHDVQRMPCNVNQRPLTDLKGVGEARAKDFHQLGIYTIEDLLLYFPHRYEDRRLRDLSEAGHDEQITVQGTVHSVPSVRFYGKKKSRLSVKVRVDRYLVTAVMFNRHYAQKQLKIGRTIRMTGKLDKHRLQITVQDYQLNPEVRVQEEDMLVPVYPVQGKISVSYLRKIIQQALRQFGSHIPEILPQALVHKYRLWPRQKAIRVLHQMKGYEDGKWAKRRMIYEEFFLFQLKIQALKKKRKEHIPGIRQRLHKEHIARYIQTLPFSLTRAQQLVLDSILTDMQADSAMNRLLQGDVGSGKTIVAAIALYASINAGYQGAFMVPTEILAEQHFYSLKQFFHTENIHIALLTGSTSQRMRKDILAGLQMGTIDLVIGTHALIQDDVYFKNLGLVVTDEQHRFGVEQRRKLRQKGKAPDVLFMTATPIPRTLSITAFGDLDVSIIDELPGGRKPIQTYWVKPNMMERIHKFIHKEVSQGRQAYVICPLIEESDKMDYENALEVHAQLTNIFPQFQIGLLHGRQPQQEKEEVMDRFAQNDIQVLVSTTVVEVGVDVPNATVMIIQDAERFGLSQLHQLRGRVGRGRSQSYCILVADPKTETAKERMNILQSTTDGFEVSKRDLKLRGPGEFFGKKQSGMPEFKVGDMIHDHKTMETARKDVMQLIHNHTFWTEREYALLRSYLEEEGIFNSDKLD